MTVTVTTEMWVIRQEFAEKFYNGQAIPSLQTDPFTGVETVLVPNTWVSKLIAATRFETKDAAFRVANLLVVQGDVRLEVKKVKVIRKA